MTGRNGCCVTESGRSARSLPGAKNRRFSPSLFFPIHTLKSPVSKSAGPRGWCPLKEMGHRWILELSFLPLPGLLNKMNEEMACNCLVNSQLHPHLSMNYQTCLSVTLTCDFNITTGITLTVLTQAKIWVELCIRHFFLLQIFTERWARCFGDEEIKSTILLSIFSPSRWGERKVNSFFQTVLSW